MADMTFTCPQCQQGIQCDTQWSGKQIQCPTCQATVTVPSQQQSDNPLVPPVPAGGTRLSIGASKAEVSQAPRSLPPSAQKRVVLKKRSFDIKNYLPILGMIVVLAVAAYFGWPYFQKWQDKASAAADEAAKNSDGGQVGHIAELHGVLDATDPGRIGTSEGGTEGLPNRRGAGAQAIEAANDAAAGMEGQPGAPAKPGPVVPPVYTLDIATAKIPKSQVNGIISGTNFVAETSRLDAMGASQVLRFTQGNVASPDREIMIYLRLRPTDSLSNYVVEVTSDKRGSTLPTVVKRWKTNPRYAPQQKPYNYGYAMKLQLNQTEEGSLKGNIFLALPDTEESVIAGSFTATTSQAGAVMAAPVAAPVPSGSQMSPQERQVMQQRYGIAP